VDQDPAITLENAAVAARAAARSPTAERRALALVESTAPDRGAAAPRRTPTPAATPRLRLVRHQEIAPRPRLFEDRDPDFIRGLLRGLGPVIDRYFRTEVEGVEHLSVSRALYVCTHNGGMIAPDYAALMVHLWRRFGPEAPSFALTHEMAFRIPLYRTLAAKIGGVPACPENARLVLDHGHPLLTCPGGDEDNLKPFSERHRVVFGKRRGFIRLALEQQVPIIPVVSVGAHETMIVLNRGVRTARWLGLNALRIKCAPLTLSFPFGLTIAGLPFALPLPSKLTLRVLPPIRLAAPCSAAKDPAAVERAFEHVRGKMQEGLDDLASNRRRFLLG
jgi:1-acyl-sn-glycerol-3-phosphate acyltransferase